MDIYYRNNSGQTVNFMEWPYMLSESSLINYGWDYETRGELTPKIERFSRKMVEKTLKVSISAQNITGYREAVNNILEITEKDVRNLTPGRLYVNDEYIRCYFVQSEKSEWIPGITILVNNFTVISESGVWIKERNYVFRTGVSIGTGDKNLDYPYDFKYDFASSMEGRKINNTGIAPVDFEITIYGACLNPAVNIGGHTYRVYASLDTGEYLKINSITKKIYKVKINGETVNQFNLRERDHYIFEKIQPGTNSVTWTGAYGMDITLFEERSEPRWI